MIIIYNCLGGTHTSIMASELHLNNLPSDRIPSTDELYNTENFNKLDDRDFGRLIFHGIDEFGNEVYSIGRGRSAAVIRAMEGLAKLMSKKHHIDEGLIFINCSSSVMFPLSIGGLLSRWLKMGIFGDPFVFAGSKASYPKIVKLVERTKEICKSPPQGFFIYDIDNKGQLKKLN